MLRLQSSMASQINGGQLNELVNTAKNLLADAQTHYDKYYALPETPGMDEHRRSPGRAVPRLLRHADANERSAGAGQSGRYVQTKCRTEADRDAKVYREWREAQAALTAKGIGTMKATTNAFCGSFLR